MSVKTIDEVAREVIDGKWGNGDTRKKKVGEYFYNAVQSRVNEILSNAETNENKQENTIVVNQTQTQTQAVAVQTTNGIKGIDVSYWQDNIDWAKVKADGVKFAVLREGYRTTIDKQFIENVKGCRDNGIAVMVYHFIYTNNASIKANAEATANNIKKAGLDISKTMIWTDIEYDTWKQNGQTCTKDRCSSYLREYIAELKKLGAEKIGNYFNNDYRINYIASDLQENYPIWLADWTGSPDVPCTLQQTGDSGKVAGIDGNVDMDVLFDESLLVFDNYIDEVKTVETKTTVAQAETSGKSIEELAKEVLDGKWGNGTDRINRLMNAGYSYSEVQAKVNELLGYSGNGYNDGTTVSICHASISENGNAGWDGNARAGDQTGSEVCVRNWYDKNWDFILRYNDINLCNKASEIAQKLARSNLVGYDQSERNTLYQQLKNNGFDADKYIASGVKTEADCSSFVYAVWACLVPALRSDDNAPVTSTMRSVFSRCGFSAYTDSKYTSTFKYLRAGDVIVNSASHTAMAVSNGEYAGQ